MRPSTSARRRRAALVLAAAVSASVAATLPGTAAAHELDHPAPGFRQGTLPDLGFVADGGRDGAAFELVTTIPTGNLHTDLDFFTSGGEVYAAVGTLAVGLNAGGQSIIRLTEGGQVETADGPAPVFASSHPSAACVSDPSAALGLQHDVEATPKAADLINNDSYLPPDRAKTGDAQLLLDATDARGRCHDQGTLLGLQGAPLGGLEIIDVTDVENPVEIGLTTHIGQSHTVNVDPKRPHIAYAVTSDVISTTVRPDGSVARANDTSGNALDGFEVVDLSSCMTAPFGTLRSGLTVEQKRAACRPEVYRYRYPNAEMALGHTDTSTIYGCHELKPYADDLLTCGAGGAAIVLDMSGAFDADGKPKGTPLPCAVRDSSSSALFTTGAKVTDCATGEVGGQPQSLTVSQWNALGAPSLEGVRHVGSIHHMGRGGPLPATEDNDFNHETEFTRSGRFLLATDERGGGVTPPGAACDPAGANLEGNGGIHAYRTDRLTGPGQPVPDRAQAQAAYAAPADGRGKSVYRAPVRVPAPTFCTAHVFQQVPGQTRIVMGWYTQGTQVVDYVELPGSRLQFVETGFAIPGGANQWVSHVFQADENPDGTFTYYGATGDFARQAVDVFKVTLPAPLTACDLRKGSADRSGPSGVTDRGAARGVHVENVDCVLEYGISSGTTRNADGTPATYAPAERVTRGQMASFIANALREARASDAVLPTAGADQFSDVAASTHRAAINRLAQAGVVRGLVGPGGRFAPEALISRDQMASFLVEAARFANGRDAYEPRRTDWFGDVPAGNVHERNISAGFENDLFRGTVEPGAVPRSGRFAPSVQVQRDQMATFLVNLFTASIR